MNESYAAEKPARDRVLLIDDEPTILRSFRYCLEDAGYRVATAQNGEQALACLERDVFDVSFLDLSLGCESGLDLLPALRAAAPWMRVVVATVHASVDMAVEAMHAGAADYLVKPCSPEQLTLAAEKQIQARRLETRLQALESEVGAGQDAELSSHSPLMMQVIDEAHRVSDTDAAVLLLGESGTGKGVLARGIHAWSRRRDAEFVTVSCPSLSAELLESELFGHRKGAFTGATENTLGRVHQADGGTLLLDEIGDVPLSLQPKLLRFVQDKEYEPVGDPVTRRADVRILAATNRDLSRMVKDASFREDLYYRINVITLTLPPLRERREDVLDLAGRFLSQFAHSYRRPARGFTEAARDALIGHDWPGNIRELRNLIERAVILCPDEHIDTRHLAINGESRRAPATALNGRIGTDQSLEALERAHIQAVIANASTLEAAARTLGIDASTLYRKRKQYGLA
ncbi:MAG TPA: sigma-54 dependent transcriptional regulator [Xanthomonadaceae bacterium]|nr:sigma-54 dependent transcriptional regulator [Xanthomonadaceae bacterium]